MAGAPTAGESGAAGGGGDGFTFPEEGDECERAEALACAGPAQERRLVCRNGAWCRSANCAPDEACDRRDGSCRRIVDECTDRGPGDRFCRADELGRCGPDRVTVTELDRCSGRCAESGSNAACLPPRCGDHKVQAPEECDDENLVETDACPNSCQNARCGDGHIWVEHETCEDGNTVSGDGCAFDCLREPRAIAAGAGFPCAIGLNGAVQCWGSTGYVPTESPPKIGAVVDLGVGRTAKALALGDWHACAVLDDDTAKCWGSNNSGQLGIHGGTRGDDEGEMGDGLPRVELGTGRRVRMLAAGSSHTCALLDNGTVKCWGYGGAGQLGYGDTRSRGPTPSEMGDNLPAVDLGTGRTAVSITTYYAHTCAILDDASIKCWGSNLWGSLGLGDTKARGDGPGEMGDALPRVDLGSGRTARSVSAGSYFTCALLDDASVRCWGTNDYGELGLGDKESRGDEPGEMGDALPAVDLGTSRAARDLATGNRSTCVVFDDGSLKCWGSNGDGTLGLGSGVGRGAYPGEMGQALPFVDLGTGRTVRSVDGGTYYFCALLDDSSIKCWGTNSGGQLGLGDTLNRGDEPGEMGDALARVRVSF